MYSSALEKLRQPDSDHIVAGTVGFAELVSAALRMCLVINFHYSSDELASLQKTQPASEQLCIISPHGR